MTKSRTPAPVVLSKGNDNIHAGIKSMHVRLGLAGGFGDLLSGRSNAGLTDPGKTRRIRYRSLPCWLRGFQPTFDDNVISLMLCQLRDESRRSFTRVPGSVIPVVVFSRTADLTGKGSFNEKP
jgi:hypothetical protein